MYRGFLRSMFVCSLLLGLACSLWAKPGREFYASDIRESMEKGDKLAILMVHFGSAYPEARTQVLDEQACQGGFPRRGSPAGL